MDKKIKVKTHIYTTLIVSSILALCVIGIIFPFIGSWLGTTFLVFTAGLLTFGIYNFCFVATSEILEWRATKKGKNK
jgi:hypothetical protein